MIRYSKQFFFKDKVYEELQQRFGDDQRLAEINDIQYLPYLDQVMKETQRYFMSEFLIFRHVEQSSKIGKIYYFSKYKHK